MREKPSPNEIIHAGLHDLLEQAPLLRNAGMRLILDPHRELILKARAQGHTYRAITQTLRSAGVQISPETIRRYIVRNSDMPTKPRSRVKKIRLKI